MSNYRKYLTAEDLLQEACVNYLQLQYPKVLFFHVPNEGKRTKFERFKAKVLGIKSGVSDLIIIEPNRDFNGLAIELKVGTNTPTLNQKKFLQDAETKRFKSKVIKSFDAFKEFIDFYMSRR